MLCIPLPHRVAVWQIWPVDRIWQICGQENLSPLGLAILHRAKNLLVPIHQSMIFSIYLYLKSFYMHIAWSNYGLNVLNIAQTHLFCNLWLTCSFLLKSGLDLQKILPVNQPNVRPFESHPLQSLTKAGDTVQFYWILVYWSVVINPNTNKFGKSDPLYLAPKRHSST